MQEKFFDEALLLLKPEEVILGNALRYKMKDGNQCLQEFAETSVFVSVIDTLQQMLCNEQLAKLLTRKVRTCEKPGIFYDIF